MLLSEAVEQYLLFCQAKGLGDNTVRTYRSPLRLFVRWTKDAEIESVDSMMIVRYMATTTKLRPRTRRSRLTPLRNLFNHLVKAGVVETNPFLTFPMPKKDDVRRFNVTEEESRTLFRIAGLHPDAKTAAQQKALIACMVFGGFRRSELLTMTLRSIDVEKGGITVLGKGDKERTVWIHEEGRAAIAEWLKVRPPCNHSYLWIVDNNRRMGDGRLNKILDTLWVAAGLGKAKEIRCHSLRHATATRWCENGIDIRAVQSMLGHAHLSTTAMYLHSDQQRAQKLAPLTGFKETGEKPTDSKLEWSP